MAALGRMPKISYVINTASGDPHADGGNPYRSAQYKERYRLLKEKVLPAALEQGFDEIIVAGCFEPGNGYLYKPVPPRCRDRRDALWQREIGARHATGDVLVFGHDDHALGEDFGRLLQLWIGHGDGECPCDPWDLLIPRRIHGITGAVMNNGFEDGPQGASYVGSHVIVMKRWLWAEVSWTACDTEWWDTSLTRMWKEAGGKLVNANDLTHLDVEAAEHEF